LAEKHIALRRRALARRRLRSGIGRGVGSTCHGEQSDSGENGKHAFHGHLGELATIELDR
jgi:hypothetical protein